MFAVFIICFSHVLRVKPLPVAPFSVQVSSGIGQGSPVPLGDMFCRDFRTLAFLSGCPYGQGVATFRPGLANRARRETGRRQRNNSQASTAWVFSHAPSPHLPDNPPVI